MPPAPQPRPDSILQSLLCAGWEGCCHDSLVDGLSSKALGTSTPASVAMSRGSYAFGYQWGAGGWNTAWFSAENPGFESDRRWSPGRGHRGMHMTWSA